MQERTLPLPHVYLCQVAKYNQKKLITIHFLPEGSTAYVLPPGEKWQTERNSLDPKREIK